MLWKRFFQHSLAVVPSTASKCGRFLSNQAQTAANLSKQQQQQLSKDESNDRPEFPGSRSQFTTELKFIDDSSYQTIPTFRVLKQTGEFEDEKYEKMVDLKLVQKIYYGN